MGGGARGVTAAWPAQDAGDADCCDSTEEGSCGVGPEVGERAVDEVGAKGAGGVHRGPADGARPQPGEHDVCADS